VRFDKNYLGSSAAPQGGARAIRSTATRFRPAAMHGVPPNLIGVVPHCGGQARSRCLPRWNKRGRISLLLPSGKPFSPSIGRSKASRCFKLNLASGLFRERAAGRLALALRRLVGRQIGLSLGFVRLRFLIFLIAFLGLRHGILLIESWNDLVSR
jgi:hypothetical protein